MRREAATVSDAEFRERAERLATLLERDPAYAHTRDLVVARRGETVLSRHFGHGSALDLVDTYSITKSVVATLVGIALDRGAIRSLDERVDAHLGDAVQHPYTLRDLLTMTAGTQNDGAWEIDEVMARPAGWVQWMLAAPRRHEPGTTFGYDNGATHVLGAALAEAVGASLSEFAAEHLFRPLEIDAFEWPRDPDGVDYGWGHLRLRPLDVAKLGDLYLGGGLYRGRRVVSQGFVDEATRPQSRGGPPEGVAYGFLWWTADEPFRHFFAAGYAGQSLTVVPHLDLVAVTSGDEARLVPGWRNARHAVLETFDR